MGSLQSMACGGPMSYSRRPVLLSIVTVDDLILTSFLPRKVFLNS